MPNKVKYKVTKIIRELRYNEPKLNVAIVVELVLKLTYAADAKTIGTGSTRGTTTSRAL